MINIDGAIISGATILYLYLAAVKKSSAMLKYFLFSVIWSTSILWMYIVLIMYLKDDISISAIILPCGIFVGSIISLFVGMSVSSVS